jgi:hypothetical protein
MVVVMVVLVELLMIFILLYWYSVWNEAVVTHLNVLSWQLLGEKLMKIWRIQSGQEDS